MSKHRTPSELLSNAEKQAEKNRLLKQRYGKAYERAKAQDDKARMDQAWARHQRSFTLQMRWVQKAARLRRQIALIATMQNRPAVKQVPHRTAPKPDAREQRALDKRRKLMAQAQVEWDPRTATGRRSFYVVGTGRNLRASTSHFEACFRKRADRTTHRHLAWTYFDEHCDSLHAGQIASPRYEKGVDVTVVPGSANVARLEAQRVDREIIAALGTQLHDLMVKVIYHQKTFFELEEDDGWDALSLQAAVATGVDMLARFYHLAAGARTDESRPLHHSTS